MPDSRLIRRLDYLLGGALGLSVVPPRKPSVSEMSHPQGHVKNAYLAGLRMAGVYLILFVGLPWGVFALLASAPSPYLIFLQGYGAFWAGWATTTTRLASRPVMTTLREAIPYLSATACRSISDSLRRGYGTAKLLWRAWTIGFVAAAVAGALVQFDLSTDPPIVEVVWWCAGWALLFATAAKVVMVSTFYRLFAMELAKEPSLLFALDPAQSTLVTSISRVGRVMLFFWFGIAISVAVVVPLALAWAAIFGRAMFDSPNAFVAVFVPMTASFSLGVGTIVLLRSEAAIRSAVHGARQPMLRSLEARAASLSARVPELTDSEVKQLSELRELHHRISSANSYRSIFVGGVSLAVTLIPSALGFASQLWGPRE